MAVGGGSWAARSRIPPIRCRSPRRQSLAFCKCPPRSYAAVCLGSWERTSLDLPGLPAPFAPLAFRPLTAYGTYCTADGRRYQTATQTTRPARNLGGIETQTSAHSRRPAARFCNLSG